MFVPLRDQELPQRSGVSGVNNNISIVKCLRLDLNGSNLGRVGNGLRLLLFADVLGIMLAQV